MEKLVSIMMGSKSDWPTMEHAANMLKEFGIGYEVKVLSAHRTPKACADYAASAADRGLKVVIAAAGGAAHLAGVVASKTLLPVLGVPIESKLLHGLDSLLSMVQMPSGIPVGTLAVGKAGAKNAALLAAAIIGNEDPKIRQAIADFREAQAKKILSEPDPS